MAVTYSLNGTTDTLTATAGGRTVFTLVVNANGSWTFDLDDQLDHVDNGLNDENLLLRTSLNDLVGVPSIDFSSIVVATDRDGDEITLNAGSFTIAVQDDIPVQNAVPVAATVQEDGLNAAVDEPPAGASGNDLSTGNKEGGETDAADETSGLAGSLTGLATVGSDEPLATSLSLTNSTLPTLFSQGVAVTYSLNGTTDTLTATAGGRTVFTLVVNANGSWTFDLDDQLDHVDNGLNDENLLLRTSLNDLVGVPSIDFSSIVVATDRDGDEITLNAGSFTITVQDDVPVIAISPDHAVVLNAAGPAVVFELDQDMNLLNNYGADSPGTVRFTVQTGDVSPFTSGGQPITFVVSDDGLELTGVVGAANTPVFIVTLDPANGTYTVDMEGTVDITTRVDFSSSAFNFVGGNGDWTAFTSVAGTTDLLLTPQINGNPDGTINSTANAGGVGGGGGGQNVGSTETFRIDFITNLSTLPNPGPGDYDQLGNRNHVFDNHYQTQGASAVFSSTLGSTVRFAAFNDSDAGGNDVVDDGGPGGVVPITGIAIAFNNDNLFINVTGATPGLHGGRPSLHHSRQRRRHSQRRQRCDQYGDCRVRQHDLQRRRIYLPVGFTVQYR